MYTAVSGPTRQHPRPLCRLLPSVQAEVQEDWLDPKETHRLPAAQEQPLSSPHNYSVGPVKKPETLSPAPLLTHCQRYCIEAPQAAPSHGYNYVGRGTSVNKQSRLKLNFNVKHSLVITHRERLRCFSSNKNSSKLLTECSICLMCYQR